MAQPAMEQPSRLKVYKGTALAWLVLAVWNTAPRLPVDSITAKKASLWPMKVPYLPARTKHVQCVKRAVTAKKASWWPMKVPYLPA